MTNGSAAFAQSSGFGGAATAMWGLGGAMSGPSAFAESASMQTSEALVAGSAQAAANGTLGGVGASITIQSIGSQTIVSNTISGNGNTANLNSNQTANNSGNTSNSGSVAQQTATSTNTPTVAGASGNNGSAMIVGANSGSVTIGP